MEKNAQSAEKKGILYLCATPIGNLEDMTYRGVRILAEADCIAAEDTRHTRKLLAHYDIHTPLLAYHEHNKAAQEPEILAKLLDGETVVCVSDAGLPGIADPGADLAAAAIRHGICVSPLPGANAALSALICSGLGTTRFSFVGFLPRTTAKIRETLEEIRERRDTLLFYEAPHRLRGTLNLLAEYFGEARQAALGRELTKRFEEFQRGTLGSLREFYRTNEPRGEFVLVVEGFDGVRQESAKESLAPEDFVAQKMAEGMDKKAAMREAAKCLGISRREVYQSVLQAEERREFP